MRRRDFCKLSAAALASRAILAKAQAGTLAPSGFNRLHQSYEEFCATPEGQRIFYALVDGQIVETRWDGSAWSMDRVAWGNPPELPGGSWDGVPMEAPVSGLNGKGPYHATWDSLLQYDAPEWYRDAKFGIWAHGSPQCVPEDADGYAREMYVQGSRQNIFQREHYGPPSTFGYKDLCPQWTLLNWDPDALIDTVSKNGTFILNIPGKPDGTIDSKEIAVLDKITDWIQINGDAIYSTRPWKIYGEGPDTVKSGSFQGDSISKLGPQDIRFTRNKTNTVVYAIVLGWPGKQAIIHVLGTSSPQSPAKVENVEWFGYHGKLKFRQESSAMRVQLPAQQPCNYAIALKVSLA